MANALTALRLLSIVPLVVLLQRTDRASAAWAGLVLAVAIATDLLDGRVARSRGTSSPRGQAFDHGTDFLFVTAGLATLARAGQLTGLLPALIVVAFGQYVVDSYVLHRARQLRMSALGRWNGILYFVPLVGIVVVRLAAGTPLDVLPLAPLNRAIAWVLVATTALSIMDRASALRSPRPADPGSPAAGRSARSPR